MVTPIPNEKKKHKNYVMMSASNQSTIQCHSNANERKPMHWAELNDRTSKLNTLPNDRKKREQNLICIICWNGVHHVSHRSTLIDARNAQIFDCPLICICSIRFHSFIRICVHWNDTRLARKPKLMWYRYFNYIKSEQCKPSMNKLETFCRFCC